MLILRAQHRHNGPRREDPCVSRSRYSNDELASVFDKTEAIAKVMDERREILGVNAANAGEGSHRGPECVVAASRSASYCSFS